MPPSASSKSALAELLNSEHTTLLARWALRAGRFVLRDAAAAVLRELGRTLTDGHVRSELVAPLARVAPDADALCELTLLRGAVLELAGERQIAVEPRDAALLHGAIDGMLLALAGRASERQATELELRERFVRVLGHDLRNPISAIKLGSSMLARDVQPAEARKRTAERIVSSSNRMLRMLEDLLDFMRLRPGALPELELGRVSLGELCREVVKECRADHPHREITLQVDSEVRGRCDHTRLAHALGNVISAALEHSPAGSPVNVTVRVDREARIGVRHQGPVIPASELDGIFDLARSSERPARGLGLGLFLADQIVRAHGGRIVAESSAAGTTFSLVLPSTAND